MKARAKPQIIEVRTKPKTTVLVMASVVHGICFCWFYKRSNVSNSIRFHLDGIISHLTSCHKFEKLWEKKSIILFINERIQAYMVYEKDGNEESMSNSINHGNG